jgi:uncharacterized protein (TIGR02145 family)
MKNFIYIFFIIFFAASFNACSPNQKKKAEVVKKAPERPPVEIGKQTWTTQNLDVDQFRNGEKIPEAKTQKEWVSAVKTKKPVWCYYYNDPKNGIKSGKLYNWYAINDQRGLAPAGWHIPTDEEWSALVQFLGDDKNLADKIKSNEGWKNNSNGQNTSGLSLIPGGYRYSNGFFDPSGSSAFYWSSSIDEKLKGDSIALGRSLGYDGSFQTYWLSKGLGLSVRCVRNVN